MQTFKWADNALHTALVDALPFFVKEPFSPTPKLDIIKLHKALGLSHETVYKWMQNARLGIRRDAALLNINRIVKAVNSEDNLRALTMLGRKPPTADAFLKFVFDR